MDLVVCPHCRTHRIVTQKLPKDVVVVMACPSCNELMVFFRKRVIAISRKILEEGTMEERKTHIAGVIAEFIDPSMFKGIFGDGVDSHELFNGEIFDSTGDDADDDDADPITEEELKSFLSVDIHRIDDPTYFRKHFG